MSDTYDAVILGGGPSGHSAAVRISQLGGKVALVERDFIGGICTNWGCTPSKAMIESAKVFREVREAPLYGIERQDFRVDFSRVAARRNEVVAGVRAFVTELLKKNKVAIFQGEGRMESPNRVRVLGGKLDPDGVRMHFDHQDHLLETHNIIIATGSAPLMPSFCDPGDPSIVSSNRLISIDTLPKQLAIVGGGVIGMEFATIFANLGSQVTVVEFLPRVLALMDPEISAEITRQMENLGVRIHVNHKVLSIHNGTLSAEDQQTKSKVDITSELFLIAIGRSAVVHDETYTRLGIQHTRKGVEVDDFQRTSVPGIWAIGDATGRSILAHVGIQQGIVAAENLMARPGAALRKMDYAVIPAVVYSIPEVAMVGAVPADLDGVQVVRVPFTVNLRANIEQHNEGFVKLWIKERRLLAAQAIGHNVSEIFQEYANMIALKSDIEAVADVIHIHPSYAEIARSALDQALGKAVDFYL